MYAFWVDLTATIASGQSLSSAVRLDRNFLAQVTLPSTWTAGVITFQGSMDPDAPTNWSDLYSDTAEITIGAAAAGRGFILPPTFLFNWRWLRLRSGTSASPVVQAGDRVMICGVRQFA